jgi:hypothetical protein
MSVGWRLRPRDGVLIALADQNGGSGRREPKSPFRRIPESDDQAITPSGSQPLSEGSAREFR